MNVTYTTAQPRAPYPISAPRIGYMHVAQICCLCWYIRLFADSMGGVGVNAAGMLGVIWVPDEQGLAKC